MYLLPRALTQKNIDKHYAVRDLIKTPKFWKLSGSFDTDADNNVCSRNWSKHEA